jgi:hypothetical protein
MFKEQQAGQCGWLSMPEMRKVEELGLVSHYGVLVFTLNKLGNPTWFSSILAFYGGKIFIT